MQTLPLINNYNIGHICTRLQCNQGLGNKTAKRWLTPFLERMDYSFLDPENASNKFANALQVLGFVPGDVAFTFLPKMPEQFFSFLGALKLQLVTTLSFPISAKKHSSTVLVMHGPA